MKRALRSLGRLASRLPLIVFVLLALVVGFFVKGVVSSTPAPDFYSQGDVAAQPESAGDIWTCSMHPQIRMSKPGQCPICGMDLVKVDKADEPAAGTPAPPKKEPKYACSMFCVPPLPNPGKCPVCGMEMVEVETDEPASTEVGTGGPRITLSPTAQRLAEIRTAPVERKFVDARVRLVGKLDYDETRLRYITAWVPGRLDRLYVDYTGVPVKEGEHLVYLYSPELATAQSEFLENLRAAEQMKGTTMESVRQSTLQSVEIARDKLRLWGLNEDQIAEIERRGTPADHMTIYAPIGGIVIHKNAVEGMYVQTGTRIYTIADLSRLWLKLDAYESDLAWLRYGQSVEFTVEAYRGETFTGQITFIDPGVDPKTRTVKVRVNVDNKDFKLKPEMFASAVVHATIASGGKVMDSSLAGKWMCPMHPEIVGDGPAACPICGMDLEPAESLGFVAIGVGETQPPLVIPASAPLLTGERAVVYVEVADQPGRFEGREVQLGPRAGDYYLVYSGLEEGEHVVVNGNFKIDSALQIRAEPSMMSPVGGSAPTNDHAGHAPEGGGHDHD